MKISLGQICSGDDKAANLAVIADQTERAACEGSRLIVFPEFAMYDLAVPDGRFIANAEPLDGPFVAALVALSLRHDIAIVAGMLESAPGEDRASNTLVAVSGGALVAVYRKIHLYNAFGVRESDLIIPGDNGGAVTFDLDGLTVGLHTCYDVRFPESSRELVDAGADLLLLPASWAPGPRKEHHWRVLSQARAIENTVYFAAVSQAPPISTGGSMLIDPMGIVVGEIGEAVDVVTLEISPERIAHVRAKNPSLSDRRFGVARLVEVH